MRTRLKVEAVNLKTGIPALTDKRMKHQIKGPKHLIKSFGLALLIGPSAWALQGFIATHQSELFTIATLLLPFALWQNARSIEAVPNCAVLLQSDN